MARKIKTIILSLEVAYEEFSGIRATRVDLMSRPTQLEETRSMASFLGDQAIVRRENDISVLTSMLKLTDKPTSTDKPVDDSEVISIVGMGGVGKTTLARLLYNSQAVASYFDNRIWVHVSEKFEVNRILNDILQSLGKTHVETTSKESSVSRLREIIHWRRCFLVLDDVWTDSEEKLYELKSCLLYAMSGGGSKILITTRSHRVAAMMRTSHVCPYVLQPLPEDLSWELFEKIAFRHGSAGKYPELVDSGRRIVKKCGGLPLAITKIAIAMYFQKDQSEWSRIEESEIWNFRSAGHPNGNGSWYKNGVLSVLLLSYYNLPSPWLKKCFACCSIFPKDTLIEKEKLKQIWMALGLISSPNEKNLTLEDIGSSYINILLQSSLLQDTREDDNYNITHCGMHNIVHDLSLNVSHNFSSVFDGLESNSTADMSINDDAEAVHLSFNNSATWTICKIPDRRLNNLRTFCVVGGCVDLEDVFTNFTGLRVLIVEDQAVKNLPKTVDRLKHLRYLDISRTRIRFLPRSFTKLYNLQTLRVFDLVMLPEGFGKLINLRHFYIQQYRRSPPQNLLLPRIGHLPNLQTLPFFSVSQEKGCQIEELEYLDNLGGKLTIYGLENVNSYESALKANLSRKFRVQSLELYWEGPNENSNDKDVLEGLKPHSNLRSLKFVGFQGSRFPQWMVGQNLLSLHNLVQLQLEHLDELEELPPTKRFPNLEKLRLHWLPKLESVPEDTSNLTCLRRLEISCCHSLTCLPNLNSLTTLQALEMIGCPNLTHLWEDSTWQDGILSLENLCISNCPNLEAIPAIQKLQSLRKLQIESCESLNLSLKNVGKFLPLEFLDIYSDPATWPQDIYELTSLTTLHLGGFSENIDYFPWPDTFSGSVDGIKKHYCASLRSLQLYGWPMIKSLPEQMQYLSKLTNLTIIRFDGLEALPEWLGKLQSLQTLELFACKNLKYLPSTAMECLADLHTLRINRCPLLKERCTRGTGEEWPKIAHIPNIYL
ncbi:putative disease resistance protein RGA3 [Coffea eugenioides]|uniref:putative disease resistance protein RGA3 n=1 Tax=Coffea eugenioides TaxID=49369 RepID=UPI000F606B87|nr:putative disease resistance protein RGA3 [Coffea eugenioides]XP_027159068.1 putative disease resistance protein RGA3 [Coffea eugenioides]XP_027159069.1 putative disease resistance protein RGA3 [Coffea eugenioides]XP_027159070.1 putative disease resistance protein RGA3 [Coffea eugenioides]